MFECQGPQLRVWGQQVNPALAWGFAEDLAAIGFTDPVLQGSPTAQHVKKQGFALHRCLAAAAAAAAEVANPCLGVCMHARQTAQCGSWAVQRAVAVL
jgi:hypothetical protein